MQVLISNTFIVSQADGERVRSLQLKERKQVEQSVKKSHPELADTFSIFYQGSITLQLCSTFGDVLFHHRTQ